MPTLLGYVDGTIKSDFDLEVRKGAYKFHKQYSEDIYVLSDNTSQSDDDIAGAVGLPHVGFLDIRGGRVKSKKAREVQSVRHPTTGVACILWVVTINYDSELGEDGEGQDDQGNKPPTSLRPRRRWRTEKETEVMERDPVTDEPIVTAAGEKLIVERTRSISILEISRYEVWPFNPTKHHTYIDHTNSDTFYGAPARCAYMDDIFTEEEEVNGVLYELVTYVIKFKFKTNIASEGGWDLRPLNQGYLHYDFVNPKPVTKLDKNGVPVKVNLTLLGGELPTGAQPVFLTFNNAAPVAFGPLQLQF